MFLSRKLSQHSSCDPHFFKFLHMSEADLGLPQIEASGLTWSIHSYSIQA